MSSDSPSREGAAPSVGFVETFRTVAGEPLLWTYHQRRMRDACRRGRVALRDDHLISDLARLRSEVRRLLGREGMEDGVFRYTILSGDAGADGHCHHAVESLEVRAIPDADPAAGIVLHVLRQRRDSGPWIPRPKTTDFHNTQLGLDELRARGVEAAADGLFLSADGSFVVEAIYRNIVWVRGGELRCPAPDLGPVAGTCLAWIAETFAPVVPMRAGIGELAGAEAVFVCNSVRGMTPVREIRDGHGGLCAEYSLPHPLMTDLARRWQRLGTNPRPGDGQCGPPGR